MIIKSDFKDYYDFIAHQYGEGDPRVIYVRKRLQPITAVNYSFGLEVKGENHGILALPTNHNFPCKGQAKWLIIAGKYYLIVSLSGCSEKYELFDKEKHGHLFNGGADRYSWHRDANEIAIHEHGADKLVPALIRLSREIKSPVFCIKSVYRQKLIIDSAIPILSRMDVPSLISPFQIYQDIAYFIGNTLNANPDIAPPVTLADKDRIVGHGFDLKQSFRRHT